MSDKTLELVENRCSLCSLRQSEPDGAFCITCELALGFTPPGEYLHHLGVALSIANLRDRAFYIDEVLFTYSPWSSAALYVLYLHSIGRIDIPSDALSRIKAEAEAEEAADVSS